MSELFVTSVIYLTAAMLSYMLYLILFGGPDDE